MEDRCWVAISNPFGGGLAAIPESRQRGTRHDDFRLESIRLLLRRDFHWPKPVVRRRWEYFGAQAVTPNSLSEVVVSVRARHWWWLWIPAFAWVSMIPVVLYYVWLEIITTGYFAFHPWLWFNGSWDRDVAFGLMPGFMGIGALVYGIYLSLRSVIPPKDSETTKRRVTRFLAGTVLLVSIVSPFLLNWGISHLKDMPIVKGSTSWWIL